MNPMETAIVETLIEVVVGLFAVSVVIYVVAYCGSMDLFPT